jgi:phenylalanyl-tRNA synthetase alpha chain
MFEPIEKLWNEAREQLSAIKNSQELEQFRTRVLNRAVKDLMGRIKEVPGEQKKEFGRRANELRAWAEQSYEELKSKLGVAGAKADTGPKLDLTEPGLTPIPGGLGREHVITQTIDEMIDVFGRMGFDVATGPEIEDEFHNFVALNIPESHPARDPLDNFYLSAPDPAEAKTHPRASVQMLRSQTSTIQIRVMEKTKPPVRVVATGRVYRPDEHDATHFSMFHQVEGLYVDRDVSMSDLKTTLVQFAHAMFGPEAEIRLRPSFFPFTEPSAELDVKMNVRGTVRWVELGGCGMVDPNVFKAVGYDPEEWTGFAFGLGIERLAMRKYGITDIRWLFENDVRFLRQF